MLVTLYTNSLNLSSLISPPSRARSKAYRVNRKKENRANFIKKKEYILKKLEEKQKRLENVKECIQKAETHKEFKGCRRH